MIHCKLYVICHVKDNSHTDINKFVGMTPKNLTTVQGERRFLSCSKPDGIPEPDIYWTHNGSKIDVTLRSGKVQGI